MAIIMISIPFALTLLLVKNKTQRKFKAWDRSRKMYDPLKTKHS